MDSRLVFLRPLGLRLLKEEDATRLTRDMVRSDVLCPACQRMRDDNPAGIATFTGSYLVAHEDEVGS